MNSITSNNLVIVFLACTQAAVAGVLALGGFLGLLTASV